MQFPNVFFNETQIQWSYHLYATVNQISWGVRGFLSQARVMLMLCSWRGMQDRQCQRWNKQQENWQHMRCQGCQWSKQQHQWRNFHDNTSSQNAFQIARTSLKTSRNPSERVPVFSCKQNPRVSSFSSLNLQKNTAWLRIEHLPLGFQWMRYWDALSSHDLKYSNSCGSSWVIWWIKKTHLEKVVWSEHWYTTRSDATPEHWTLALGPLKGQTDPKGFKQTPMEHFFLQPSNASSAQTLCSNWCRFFATSVRFDNLLVTSSEKPGWTNLDRVQKPGGLASAEESASGMHQRLQYNAIMSMYLIYGQWNFVTFIAVSNIYMKSTT